MFRGYNNLYDSVLQCIAKYTNYKKSYSTIILLNIKQIHIPDVVCPLLDQVEGSEEYNKYII